MASIDESNMRHTIPRPPFFSSFHPPTHSSQVISSLGIFNSRVHLVSMAEAVKGDPTEEPKFRSQIPSIAQVCV